MAAGFLAWADSVGGGEWEATSLPLFYMSNGKNIFAGLAESTWCGRFDLQGGWNSYDSKIETSAMTSFGKTYIRK